MGATAGSRASEAGFKRQICTTSEFIKSARTVRAVNKFPGCAAFSYVQIIVTDDRAMPLLGQDILSTSASVNIDYNNLRLDLRSDGHRPALRRKLQCEMAPGRAQSQRLLCGGVHAPADREQLLARPGGL